MTMIKNALSTESELTGQTFNITTKPKKVLATDIHTRHYSTKPAARPAAASSQQPAKAGSCSNSNQKQQQQQPSARSSSSSSNS